MNRSSFLKSIVILLAAPQVLSALPKSSEIAKDRKLIIFRFKMSSELLTDTGFMSFVEQEIIEKCEQGGIDFSKPYDIKAGWENEDFINNIRTIVIKQYVKVQDAL